MKIILRISSFLLVSMHLTSCSHTKNHKSEPLACEAQIILQLENISDNWENSIGHFESLINRNFDSFSDQSIVRTGFSISKNSIDFKVINYQEEGRLIQLNLSTAEKCACEILLDTFTLVINEGYAKSEKERIDSLFNLELAPINSRLEEIQQEIKNHPRQSTDFRNLEMEYTQLIEQKVTIRIAQAGEIPGSFRVLRSAIRKENKRKR